MQCCSVVGNGGKFVPLLMFTVSEKAFSCLVACARSVHLKSSHYIPFTKFFGETIFDFEWILAASPG